MIGQSGFRTAPLYSVEVGSWRFKERLSGSQTAVPQAPLALMKFFSPRMIHLSTDHKWSKLLGGIQLVSPQRTQRDVNFTIFQLRLDVLKPLLNLYQLLFLARACIPGPVIHIQTVVTTSDLPTQHVFFYVLLHSSPICTFCVSLLPGTTF